MKYLGGETGIHRNFYSHSNLVTKGKCDPTPVEEGVISVMNV